MERLKALLLERRKKRILLLDDEPAVVRSLKRSIRQLREDWELETATDPDEAWLRLQRETFDVLVTDVRMPKLTGLTLLERMQADPKTAAIPVVVVTGWGDYETKLKALELGAVDLLEKPVEPRHLVARLEQVLRWKEGQDVLAAWNTRLRRMLDRQVRELVSARLGSILRLMIVAQQREPDLAYHGLRVAVYAKKLTQLAGLGETKAHEMFWSGLVHDLGKVALPDSLLKRAGPFSPGETLTWQKHCLFGEQILRGRSPWTVVWTSPDWTEGPEASILECAVQATIAHHELWDGTGFPHGLEGENIPLPGRIVALADAFDHATRPVVRGRPQDAIRNPFAREAAQFFDPALLEILRQHEAKFRQLADSFQQVRWDDQNWLAKLDQELATDVGTSVAPVGHVSADPVDN